MITSPSAGTITGTVSLQSNATDAGSGVSSVAYYSCTSSCTGNLPGASWSLIGTGATGPTWTFSWNTTTFANGAYTLKAVMTDAVGNPGVTVAVAVTVSNATNKLVITSTAVDGAAASNANLGPITVQQQTSTGTPVNATGSGLTVTLSGPTGSSFATSQFGTSTTTVTIPNGSSSVTFYYGNSNVSGSSTITAASTGLTSGSQVETITTAPAGFETLTGSGVSCGAPSADVDDL